MSDDDARYRVKFRYRADTGEVEYFTIDSLDGEPLSADHDARHESAATALANVIERDAQIDEVHGAVRRASATEQDAEPEAEHAREQERAGSD